MSRYYLQIRLLPLLFLGVSLCALAQMGRSTSTSLSLEQIAARAGMIFSGTVQQIEPDGDSVIRVSFKVKDGIRGVHAGEIITIREWAAVSPRGAPARYRVGEKILVFFHAAGPNGLTSPVGGDAGVLHFGDSETLKLTDEQNRALARSPRLKTVASAGDEPNGNVLPAANFIRALRLVTSSP